MTHWFALGVAGAAVLVALWAAAEARGSRRASERSAAAAERQVALTGEAHAAILKLGDARVGPAPEPWKRWDMLDVEIVNAGQGPARRVTIREVFLEDWGWTNIIVSDIPALAAGEQVVISFLIPHELAPFPFRLRAAWLDSIGERTEDLLGDVTIPIPWASPDSIPPGV